MSEATRVTADSRMLIDHMYANCPENVTSIDVPKVGLSDHFPIFFTCKLHVQQSKGKHHSISYRSFKNFDEAKFFSDLKAVPWYIIHLFDDNNDILDAWSDLFLQIVYANIPIKQHRVKYKNQPQWITPDILDAMKCKDRHKSLGNENEFKYWRNMIRKAKQEKYQTYIKTNKGKPGSIYKLFQEVGAGKGCRIRCEIGSVNIEVHILKIHLKLQICSMTFLLMQHLNSKNLLIHQIMINLNNFVMARSQMIQHLKFHLLIRKKFDILVKCGYK